MGSGKRGQIYFLVYSPGFNFSDNRVHHTGFISSVFPKPVSDSLLSYLERNPYTFPLGISLIRLKNSVSVICMGQSRFIESTTP